MIAPVIGARERRRIRGKQNRLRGGPSFRSSSIVICDALHSQQTIIALLKLSVHGLAGCDCRPRELSVKIRIDLEVKIAKLCHILFADSIRRLGSAAHRSVIHLRAFLDITRPAVSFVSLVRNASSPAWGGFEGRFRAHPCHHRGCLRNQPATIRGALATPGDIE